MGTPTRVKFPTHEVIASLPASQLHNLRTAWTVVKLVIWATIAVYLCLFKETVYRALTRLYLSMCCIQVSKHKHTIELEKL